MLTQTQKTDLQTVLTDYANALTRGDDDAVDRTWEALDATVATMRDAAREDQDNLALWTVIQKSLDEWTLKGEEALWVHAAKLIVGTL